MTRLPVLLLAAPLLALPSSASAQEQEGFVWENSTELSFASTGGNASSRTFALGTEVTGTGGPNSFKIEAGGIRASSGITTRTATGTVDDFTVSEQTESELSAASYFARARYDRAFDGAFAFGGAGWERNTFSGIDQRYSVVSGLGRTWVDNDTGHFKTDLGLTYTIQKDVEPEPNADEGFLGARAQVDAERSLTETTVLASKVVADQSIEQGEDFRADWLTSLAVSISDALALKTSFQLLYDHRPAFVPVTIVGGADDGRTVRTEGEKIDTVLKVALVIEF